ncbi:MAG: tRNA (adenosine(37)-N6)-dimethylallyltransferase MiaA [Salinibacterium sp.]|nr:tRNA (adenosine(37)-N6)-dimethylallyltransferase MiaA [Salinibacterium sp.]
MVGATGTGKSQLALDLAEDLIARGLGAEIVNADAMQLYRGMDVGTAKVGVAERRGIPHHMLDVLEPREEASVADYQTRARRAIEEIEGRGSVPILVGGSGLYVSSVIQDFVFPGTDPVIRDRLEAELVELGPFALHGRLTLVDPASAEAIGPHNGRRIVRALEVVELTGQPFTAGLPELRKPWRSASIIGLIAARDALLPRLAARVRGMWQLGMLDEVRGLMSVGFGVTAARAIGYAQAIEQLDGLIDEDAAIAGTIALTSRYARRQVSWFSRYRDAHWIDFDDPQRREMARQIALRVALQLAVRED